MINNKKIIIPAAVILLLIIVGGTVLWLIQPQTLDFWTHVDAHTKYTELQQQYNPDPEGWKINYIDVLYKETPDSAYAHVKVKDEAKLAELVDILGEITVVDKPREAHDMGTYSYALCILHPNYMDIMIEFDKDLDEMWIIFSYTNAPAYKIKNTSAFKDYLKGLFG